MDERQEMLEVFNRHNRLIGQAKRGTIHQLGLRHRAVHIFVINNEDKLYMQLRRDHKDQYPRHWDTSAAGHVSPGESYAAAAARELAEELRLQEKITCLTHVNACRETGWEHVGLFQCQTGSEPAPNPEEIERGAFFTLAEIDHMLGDISILITPAFRLLYGLWKNFLLEKE